MSKSIYKPSALLTIITLLLSACAQPTVVSTPPTSVPAVTPTSAALPSPTEASASTSKYQESPILAEQVAEGQLPPVDERLPAEPLVIGDGTLLTKGDVPFAVGQYNPGRVWTGVHSGGFAPLPFLTNVEPLIAAPSLTLDNFYGNIVKDFSVSEDGKIFSFTLRKGLKWSDGQPVTMADVRFAIDDVLFNPELTPDIPSTYQAGGEVMKVTYVDDFTFTITFATNNGGFLRDIALSGWANYMQLLKPSHYLKQFHSAYTPQADLEKLAIELKLDDSNWQTLYNAKDCVRWDITSSKCTDLPQLSPWIVSEVTDGAVIFDRNPYYFKVDAEGKQLPYIDRLVSVRVDDTDAINARAISGDFDIATLADLTPLSTAKEGEAQGGYTTRLYPVHGSRYLIIQSCNADPVFGPILKDVRFREAINDAINRDELNDSVFLGFGQGPSWHSFEYNQERANQLLDEVGLDKRDADGFRLGPDGKPFNLVIESTNEEAPDQKLGELIAEQLKPLGLNTVYKMNERSLMDERLAANQPTISVAGRATPLWPNGAWTDWAPDFNWCPSWNTWKNENGQGGVEPYSPDAKRLLEIRDLRAWAVPGSAEDKALYTEHMEILKNNLWLVSLIEGEREGWLIKNDLRNVATDGVGLASAYAGEQWWFESK